MNNNNNGSNGLSPSTNGRKPNDDPLIAALQRELAMLEQYFDRPTACRIAAIVRTNWQRGRVRLYLQDNRSRAAREYVWLVIETYRELAPYVEDLQAARRPEVVQPLFEQLQQWAYNLLLQKECELGPATFDTAVARAQTALAAILTAHFPYDVQFEAWATLQLQRVCRQQSRSGYQLTR